MLHLSRFDCLVGGILHFFGQFLRKEKWVDNYLLDFFLWDHFHWSLFADTNFRSCLGGERKSSQFSPLNEFYNLFTIVTSYEKIVISLQIENVRKFIWNGLKIRKFTHVLDKTANTSFCCRRQHSYGGKPRATAIEMCGQIFSTSARRRRHPPSSDLKVTCRSAVDERNALSGLMQFRDWQKLLRK